MFNQPAKQVGEEWKQQNSKQKVVNFDLLTYLLRTVGTVPMILGPDRNYLVILF